MPWPTVVVDTTNMDAAGDNPGNARAAIKQMADNVNAIKDMRGVANGVASTDATNKVPVAQLPTIPANQGGTGQTVYAVGDLLVANTTTTLAKVSPGAVGTVLTSTGTSSQPTFQTPSNVVPDASDTVKGIVELATTAETTTGTDTTRAVTPAGVKAATDALVIGGMTLLGTLTASGVSVTLSGLNLTGYKFVFIEVNNVAGGTNAVQRIGGIAYTNANSVNYHMGHIWLNLSSGFFISHIFLNPTFAVQSNSGTTSYNTSTTSIVMSVSAGSFWTSPSGVYKFYGVK